jgi:hypothetical protein
MVVDDVRQMRSTELQQFENMLLQSVDVGLWADLNNIVIEWSFRERYGEEICSKSNQRSECPESRSYRALRIDCKRFERLDEVGMTCIGKWGWNICRSALSENDWTTAAYKVFSANCKGR